MHAGMQVACRRGRFFFTDTYLSLTSVEVAELATYLRIDEGNGHLSIPIVTVNRGSLNRSLFLMQIIGEKKTWKALPSSVHWG